jgi:hypothetical protein
VQPVSAVLLQAQNSGAAWWGKAAACPGHLPFMPQSNANFPFLPQSNAKTQYLLSDTDLRKLGCLERSNPQHKEWSTMKMYLVSQVGAEITIT